MNVFVVTYLTNTKRSIYPSICTSQALLCITTSLAIVLTILTSIILNKLIRQTCLAFIIGIQNLTCRA